jgi:hypothetical protein
MLTISIHPLEAEISVKSFPEISARCVEIITRAAHGGVAYELTIWMPTGEIAEEVEAALRKVFPAPKPVEPETDPDYEDIV